MNIQIIDSTLYLINKLKTFRLTGKTAQNLYNELQKEHKNNVPLILARIQSLDADEERSKHLKTQISLANELLDLIKVNELLASFAILKIEKKEILNHNHSTNSANNNSTKKLVNIFVSFCFTSVFIMKFKFLFFL
jgi:hypothetical protein